MPTAELNRALPIRTRRVLATLATAVLVAGCGGGGGGDDRMGKNEYVGEFNKIQSKLGKAMDSVSTASANPKAATAALNSTVKELDAAITDMKALSPPEEWQVEHDSMLAALQEIRGAMDEMAKANGDPAVLQGALKKIEAAATKGEAAQKGINSKR